MRKSMFHAFINWMNERHSIYLKRKAGKDKNWPWTKDKILREYKFTNVFRQLDRVTIEWANRYSKLLALPKPPTEPEILFHCIMFRIFNWPPTYDALNFNMRNGWDLQRAIQILRERKEEDFEQIFTGAYIVTGAGKDQAKHITICEALDEIHMHRGDYCRRIMEAGTMENAVAVLSEAPTVGLFVAYEIACDLRFTKVLAHAKDIRSWANPGPGAKRGIHRIWTGSKDKPGKKINYVQAMRTLYTAALASGKLLPTILKAEWPFEMREIEHSLCEFDKYQRVKNGEGRPRSRYKYKNPEDADDRR